MKAFWLTLSVGLSGAGLWLALQASSSHELMSGLVFISAGVTAYCLRDSERVS